MNNDDFIRMEEDRDRKEFNKCMSGLACFFLTMFLIVIIWKSIE
jgi:hypothetical protein